MIHVCIIREQLVKLLDTRRILCYNMDTGNSHGYTMDIKNEGA